VHDELSVAAAANDDCWPCDCNAVYNCCSRQASTSVPEDINDWAMRHFAWISQCAPQFAVNGTNVHVLSEPSDFYETLKVCSLSSV